ncbi:MAG TPA: hypothetical protein VLH09_14880 [Bryobacteraceae bacterium]|nr:hypothetical protein [Bryobacteraceae bacterium]
MASIRTAVSEATRLASQPSPEALDNCAEVLAQARQQLEILATTPLPADPSDRSSARAALERLRRSLDQMRSLLDHAAGYWAGWMRLKDAMASGYTGHGEAAPAPRPGKLSLEG